MSIHDVRPSSSASVPRPRSSGSAAVAPQGTAIAPQGTAVAPQGTAIAPQGTAIAPQEAAAAPRPWEPWRLSDGVRPSTQYWDVGTASWRSRDPGSRRAD